MGYQMKMHWRVLILVWMLLLAGCNTPVVQNAPEDSVPTKDDLQPSFFFEVRNNTLDRIKTSDQLYYQQNTSRNWTIGTDHITTYDWELYKLDRRKSIEYHAWERYKMQNKIGEPVLTGEYRYSTSNAQYLKRVSPSDTPPREVEKMSAPTDIGMKETLQFSIMNDINRTCLETFDGESYLARRTPDKIEQSGEIIRIHYPESSGDNISNHGKVILLNQNNVLVGCSGFSDLHRTETVEIDGDETKIEYRDVSTITRFRYSDVDVSKPDWARFQE
jgi:hypothetical protein